MVVYLNPPVGLEAGDIAALVGDGPIPIGVAQGQWIHDTQPKGAEIALLNGDLATNYALLMQKGDKSVLQADFDRGMFKLVADKGAVNWDPSDAQKQAAAILVVSNPSVKAFVVGNDGLAGGVINAIKNAGETSQIAVIGLDGDVEGTQEHPAGLRDRHRHQELQRRDEQRLRGSGLQPAQAAGPDGQGRCRL